jgi:hypothetical protein
VLGLYPLLERSISHHKTAVAPNNNNNTSNNSPSVATAPAVVSDEEKNLANELSLLFSFTVENPQKSKSIFGKLPPPSIDYCDWSDEQFSKDVLPSLTESPCRIANKWSPYVTGMSGWLHASSLTSIYEHKAKQLALSIMTAVFVTRQNDVVENLQSIAYIPDIPELEKIRSWHSAIVSRLSLDQTVPLLCGMLEHESVHVKRATLKRILWLCRSHKEQVHCTVLHHVLMYSEVQCSACAPYFTEALMYWLPPTLRRTSIVSPTRYLLL